MKKTTTPPPLSNMSSSPSSLPPSLSLRNLRPPSLIPSTHSTRHPSSANLVILTGVCKCVCVYECVCICVWLSVCCWLFFLFCLFIFMFIPTLNWYFQITWYIMFTIIYILNLQKIKQWSHFFGCNSIPYKSIRPENARLCCCKCDGT